MERTGIATDIAVGDHRELLDIIDKLRSQGVSRYVALPEIIVCGDQSSGKSSILEAISSMPFPTKDGLCTRFPTELILRRGIEVSTKVSITPGESRYGPDKDRLQNWQPEASIDKEGLGAVIEEAKRAMAQSSVTGEFYEDILRIELTGPEQPHLTMVDLPGLFRGGDKQQSEADIDIVRGLVKKYMARPRSIILTVVSAQYGYVLQEVTSMARRADPEGLRTIGLITKPDTLDVGSDSEAYYIRLAQNLEKELRLGWHVLKNRNFEERKTTTAERDRIEKEFFSRGLWSNIDSANCGVATLKDRLSAVLMDQILAEFPSLVRDVERNIQDCDNKILRLGPERSTPRQQSFYLLEVCQKYRSLMTQAVDGIYTDPFFGNRQNKGKFHTRLRAVVFSQLKDFGDEMQMRGQSEYIIDSEGEDEGVLQDSDAPRVARSQYIERTASLLKSGKGRELPGLFNPLIVSDLFIKQCEPWGEITRSFTENILESAHLATECIIEQITASDVTEGILQIVRLRIGELKVEMDSQIDVLLALTKEHPITYNSQLTENVQRVQQARNKRAVKKLVEKAFGLNRFKRPDNTTSLNPIQLMSLLEDEFEPDMEKFGSSLAVDYMEAYYKVALHRFIDDVCTLAIEKCLISKLPTLLGSSTVEDLSDEEISSLAGESQDTKKERQRLEAKQKILEAGLQSLKRLHKHRNVVGTQQDQVASEDAEQTPAMTPGRSRRSSVSDSIAEASLASNEALAPKEVSIYVNEVVERLNHTSVPEDIWGASRRKSGGFFKG
jgi:hypothetical protein